MFEFSYLEIIAIILLIVFAFKLLLSILRGIWSCFLGHLLGFGIKWRTGDNVWAVITGATDGIGLQYAKQLALKGYNLVIISRSEDKLKTTKDYLIENYKKCKNVKTIAVDFSRTDIYDTIAEELNKLSEIYVLVNNVGTIYMIPEFYLNIPKEFNENYLNINMVSAVKMIEIVLPRMVEKGSGVMINVSSSISETPLPLYTTYGATKAFFTALSQTLSVEYESKGVYIQTVVPNQVKTKLTDNVYMPFLAVTSEDYVSAAIKTVGIETFTCGHWKHKLLAYFTNIFRSLTGNRIFMKIAFKSLLDLKQKYYKQNNLDIKS